MMRFDFSPSQKVSVHLSFALILILSFLAAWFSVAKAGEIIENSKKSPTFNIQARIQKEMPGEKQKK